MYIPNINAFVLSASTKWISAKKALKLYKDKALDSMFKELQTLNEKGTFTTMDPNTLTKKEFKSVVL